MNPKRTSTNIPILQRSKSLLGVSLATAGLTLASVALAPTSALAAVIFDYGDNLVPGNPLPEGTPPYLTALIQDINDDANLNTGQVRITLTNNLAGTSSVTQVAFNISPFNKPTTSDGSIVGGPSPPSPIPIPNGPPLKTSVTVDSNNIKVPGSTTETGFDLSIDMNPQVYRSGKTLSIIVTDLTSPPLTASAFLAKNNDGAGDYYTLAKIQSIGSGDRSTVIVGRIRPIPGPLPILGAGIAFAYSRRLRRRIGNKPSPASSGNSLFTLA